MFNKIKKTNWVRFCKQFNRANQYRSAQVRIEYESTDSVVLMESSTFFGITITKRGRWVEEINLIGGSSSFDKVIEPIASIFQPTMISSTTDEHGIDSCLIIASADGTTLSLSLEGEPDTHHGHHLKKEVAHSIYEQRGSYDGCDIEDWLKAEKIILETEHELV